MTSNPSHYTILVFMGLLFTIILYVKMHKLTKYSVDRLRVGV